MHRRARIRRIEAKRPPAVRVDVTFADEDDPATRERAIQILWGLLDRAAAAKG